MLVSKGGRIFYAKVSGTAADGLVIEPITRNISYRRAKASEVIDHWSHAPATRRAGRVAPAQIALDLP